MAKQQQNDGTPLLSQEAGPTPEPPREVVQGEVMEAEVGGPNPDDVEMEPTPETALAPVERDIQKMREARQFDIQLAQVNIEHRAACIALVKSHTRPQGWMAFGSLARCIAVECRRMAVLMGVSYQIIEPARYDYEDVDGQYYVYSCTGRFWMGDEDHPRTGYGVASSRGMFFAKSHGEWRSLREINPAFVAKMSYTECLKDGIRSLLGLECPVDELEATFGFTPEDMAGRFGGGGGGNGGGGGGAPKDHSAEDTADEHTQRLWIGQKCMEMASGDVGQAGAFLSWLTTFVAKDGKTVKGKGSAKALTGKQVAMLHKWKDKKFARENWIKFLSGEPNS